MDKRRPNRAAKPSRRPPSLLFLAVAFAIIVLWLWSSVVQADAAPPEIEWGVPSPTIFRLVE